MKMKMFGRWRRRSWVADRVDPTQVTQWTLRTRWLDIELIGSWGVEARTQLFGRRFWSYDAWWAKRLFTELEVRWEEQQAQYDDDPMGRLSDYE